MSPVKKYLSQSLPSTTPGFRQNPSQLDYAVSIEQALSLGPGRLHCIEGDTGIGKTLAYMIAGADWISHARKEPRRLIIATFSRSLQRQVLSEENQARVNAYCDQRGHPRLRFASRMGRANYASAEKLASVLKAFSLESILEDASRSPHDKALARWQLSTEACLLDLEGEALPDGFSRADIAMGDNEPVHEALEAHFAQAQRADIVVINHALLVNDLVQGGHLVDLFSGEVALVIDEGEHFPEVAESCLTRSLSYDAVTRVARRLGYRRNADRWAALLERQTDPGLSDSAQVLSDAHRHELLGALAAIKKTPRLDPDTSADHFAWNQIREVGSDLEARIRRDDTNIVVGHSRVRGLPRIIGSRPNAGAVIRNGLSDRITIFTSATLSDIQGEGRHPNFRYILGRLTFSTDARQIGIQSRHEATGFGSLRFRIPEAPGRPLEVDPSGAGGYRLTSIYAAYAVQTILSELHGRTLVLCSSYRDVDILTEHWPDRARGRLVTHPIGAALNMVAESMNDNGVLITPAGWEGLSPTRKDKKSFWSRIVLLRNPTPMINQASLLLLTEQYRQHGHSRQEAKRRADRALHSQARIKSLHRIRQGIGRGLRHPDDIVEIVILDPRFRSDGRMEPGKLVGMAAAIPTRFHRQFIQNAQPSTEKELLVL